MNCPEPFGLFVFGIAIGAAIGAVFIMCMLVWRKGR